MGHRAVHLAPVTKGPDDRRPRLRPGAPLTNYIPNPRDEGTSGRGKRGEARARARASKGRTILYPIMYGRLAAGPPYVDTRRDFIGPVHLGPVIVDGRIGVI